MDTEEWRTVIYNGEVWKQYEVSSYGRIRSLKYGKMKLMKLRLKNGYLDVKIFKNGNSKTILIHRAVAEVFIPNPDNKPTVNHINEDKTDNRVENLEWATYKEQVHHGTRTERVKHKKEKRVRCVETGVIYNSITEAVIETGLDQSSISKCCIGERQTCGKCHWEYVD